MEARGAGDGAGQARVEDGQDAVLTLGLGEEVPLQRGGQSTLKPCHARDTRPVLYMTACGPLLVL
jgi:hypothetical protein